jgi:hypothetical protein
MVEEKVQPLQRVDQNAISDWVRSQHNVIAQDIPGDVFESHTRTGDSLEASKDDEH